MNDQARRQRFDDLGRSLERLAEALRVPEGQPLAIDGTIQRFEFTFELFWKAIRRLLSAQGIEANSPKAVLQQAYRLGWLEGEQKWLKVLEDRNLTSHTYRTARHGDLPAHSRPLRRDARGVRQSTTVRGQRVTPLRG